jgi:tetratricopeptide (TPR) repeat protein
VRIVPVAAVDWLRPLSGVGCCARLLPVFVRVSGVACCVVAGCRDSTGGVPAGPPTPAAASAQSLFEAMSAAEKALDDGRLDDALTLARFVAERDTGSTGQELLGRVWLAHATRAERSGADLEASTARKAAAAVYRLAADRDRSNAALQDATAMVLDTTGDQSAAALYYDRAVELEPRNVGYRLHRANSYLRRSALDEALRDADLAIEISPEEAWAHAIRAEVALSRGETDSAAISAAEARRLAPSEVAFRVLHARILRRSGRGADAVELLAALDETSRGSIAVAAELAAGWDAIKRPERAAEAWELAYRHAQRHDQLRAAVTAGEFHLKAGNRTAAKYWLDRATTLAPDNPTVTQLAASLAAPAQ